MFVEYIFCTECGNEYNNVLVEWESVAENDILCVCPDCSSLTWDFDLAEDR